MINMTWLLMINIHWLRINYNNGWWLTFVSHWVVSAMMNMLLTTIDRYRPLVNQSLPIIINHYKLALPLLTSSMNRKYPSWNIGINNCLLSITIINHNHRSSIPNCHPISLDQPSRDLTMTSGQFPPLWKKWWVIVSHHEPLSIRDSDG